MISTGDISSSKFKLETAPLINEILAKALESSECLNKLGLLLVQLYSNMSSDACAIVCGSFFGWENFFQRNIIYLLVSTFRHLFHCKIFCFSLGDSLLSILFHFSSQNTVLKCGSIKISIVFIELCHGIQLSSFSNETIFQWFRLFEISVNYF